MSHAASSPTPIVLHGSCVALGAQALLILGASGSGKSALALQMMALGAELVADDRVCVRCLDGSALQASAPEALRGMIEARGLGLLRVLYRPNAFIRAAVDLDTTEQDRLPHTRETSYLGCTVPLFHKAESPAFPAALMAYLRGERISP